MVAMFLQHQGDYALMIHFGGDLGRNRNALMWWIFLQYLLNLFTQSQELAYLIRPEVYLGQHFVSDRSEHKMLQRKVQEIWDRCRVVSSQSLPIRDCLKPWSMRFHIPSNTLLALTVISMRILVIHIKHPIPLWILLISLPQWHPVAMNFVHF